MKSNVMKMTGLVLAVAGALSIANAQGSGEKGGQSGKRQKSQSAAELIKQFDKDGDSKLSEIEVTAMLKDMKSRRSGGGEEGSSKRGGPRLSREEMMKKYDKDGDGVLSPEERKVMMEEMKTQRRKSTE